MRFDGGASRALLASLVVGSCSRNASPEPSADRGPGAVTSEVMAHAERSAGVRYLGRADARDAAGAWLAWPGTGAIATFTGSGLTVKLRDTGTTFFSVVVDRGVPTTLATNASKDTYSLAAGLAPGTHTVVLTKRTEAGFGIVQLLSFMPTGGALLPPPPPSPRRIEYLGDSITTGLGDRGLGPNCRSTAENEDATVAYAQLAAAMLDSEASLIAYSGIGMYRNASGATDEAMPARFARSLPDDRTSGWAFAEPAPAVVVIHLGTNDFARGDPGEPFRRAYVKFLEALRARYPQTPLVCALSPMLSDAYPPGELRRTKARAHLQAVVETRRKAGDAHVSLFEFDEQKAADGAGCDDHPNLQTHQRMAAKLVSALRPLTGW